MGLSLIKFPQDAQQAPRYMRPAAGQKTRIYSGNFRGILAILAAIMLLASRPAPAVTYYVATNGSDVVGTTGTNWVTAFQTISNAVAKAQTNALNDVLVSNGAYELAAVIKITNGIAVRAFYPDVSATVINGKNGTRCLQLSHPDALVAGFTITNGFVINDGGGAYLSSGTLSNCVIIGNTASNYGGGIYIGATGMVVDCSIIANSTTNLGGGIALVAVTPYTNGIVRNCLIASNESVGTTSGKGRGGGVHLTGGLVENCRISHNTSASYGGGANFAQTAAYPGYMRSCLLTHNYSMQGGAILIYSNNFVDNCTIVSNQASYGGGGVQNQGLSSPAMPSGGRFENCIIWLNSVITAPYSNYYDRNNGGYYTNCLMAPIPVYGTSNFADDPLFVGKDTGNWRVLRDSHCINAGLYQTWMDGALDLDGRHRLDLFSRSVDIGCYEYVPRGTMFEFR